MSRAAEGFPDPIIQFRDDVGAELIELDGANANDKMESLAALYKIMSTDELRALVKFRKKQNKPSFF